jgi:hypothetical protein
VLLLSDFRSKIVQLRASDFGMVFGITLLEIELELTHYLSAMVAKLSGIRGRAIDCAGPICLADFNDLLATGKHIEDSKTKICTVDFTENGPLQLEQIFMVMMTC